ncbi:MULTISPECIES: segregation and condensation protein A [Pseudoalteromonas]|uniref:Segregation and condensation protein A n=1 Tax=Pseudoalteromonas ruthenica TaxID=151081 RepID=A0A0F4PXC3_9GAMM|nr:MULTISPECIES: ScpA family protein [Pseudoalteromonas]KJY99666.1 segregation and condensation protein A [Pseudoalteromonas ruthenica]KJZ00116.1 segregation and condensation protein A [Pseudoalteromonas ruthenica]MCF2861417.1 segregation/condensation protein A [Pseudoalteromonas sp. CNAT2-18]MCG7557544.1 segregation/condensation protein A [Pseudoalteromonas sp. CNAT2-18.1]MCG7565128.1 segregation/condensation protein A [Pseudoalteromonas sp. CnMc7-15]
MTQDTLVEQQKLPLAFIRGEAVVEKPEDLYIPPDALEVVLETFEGPLDLLLYLIKKHKLDVLELSIFSITEQYMRYVEMMREFQLELAGEYLVMAALLAQIKSRLLLPVHEELGEEEEDPRAELVRRLQEYEQFKKAAEQLDELPRMERDIFTAHALVEEAAMPEPLFPEVALEELMLALSDVMARAKTFEHHHITPEQLSTRARMSAILAQLQNHSGYIDFALLFTPQEGRAGVVVTFIAILELTKEGLIHCQQANSESAIHVRLKEHAAA